VLPLLLAVWQQLGPEEDVPSHLGVQLHDGFWIMVGSTHKVMEAFGEVRVPELGLKPGRWLCQQRLRA